MRRVLALSSVSLLFAACSTMTPARYAVSMDNHEALKRFAGSEVRVVSIDSATAYDAHCRMVGPIEAADGMTIEQFVRKAFNDELKFANVYSD